LTAVYFLEMTFFTIKCCESRIYIFNQVLNEANGKKGERKIY
jgi:hypothetical protein